MAEDLAVIAGKTAGRGFGVIAPASTAVEILACEPFQDSADTILASHSADATVLVVRQWENTRADVDAALREAATANANVVGTVLV